VTAGKFKELAVGLGNIAHLFDNTNSSEVTMHVKDYESRSEILDVSHIFDTDLEKTTNAAQNYNIPFFTDKISEL
jgi:hypothetical protein